MIQLHEAHDDTKVAALAESMAVDGWVGSPLVIWGECLLTGSHRYAAAQDAGIDVPTIAVEDVFADAGLDFAVVCADEGCDGIDSPALVYVLGTDYLPVAIRNQYGIDIC